MSLLADRSDSMDRGEDGGSDHRFLRVDPFQGRSPGTSPPGEETYPVSSPSTTSSTALRLRYRNDGDWTVTIDLSYPDHLHRSSQREVKVGGWVFLETHVIGRFGKNRLWGPSPKS